MAMVAILDVCPSNNIQRGISDRPFIKLTISEGKHIKNFLNTMNTIQTFIQNYYTSVDGFYDKHC